MCKFYVHSELCEHLLSKTCNVNYKSKGAIFYLVGITKFTNLSGNQVSLVLLHINSVYVILKKKGLNEKDFNK